MRWSCPPITYDMNDRADRARVYEQVVRKSTESDIRYYVDADQLRELFDELVLPPTRPASMGRLAPTSRPRGGVWSPRQGSSSATVPAMSESLVVTIVFEQGEDGWTSPRIAKVARARRRGRT